MSVVISSSVSQYLKSRGFSSQQWFNERKKIAESNRKIIYLDEYPIYLGYYFHSSNFSKENTISVNNRFLVITPNDDNFSFTITVYGVIDSPPDDFYY